MPNDQLPWYRKFEIEYGATEQTGFGVILLLHADEPGLGIMFYKFIIEIKFVKYKTVFGF